MIKILSLLIGTLFAGQAFGSVPTCDLKFVMDDYAISNPRMDVASEKNYLKAQFTANKYTIVENDPTAPVVKIKLEQLISGTLLENFQEKPISQLFKYRFTITIPDRTISAIATNRLQDNAIRDAQDSAFDELGICPQ